MYLRFASGEILGVDAVLATLQDGALIPLAAFEDARYRLCPSFGWISCPLAKFMAGISSPCALPPPSSCVYLCSSIHPLLHDLAPFLALWLRPFCTQKSHIWYRFANAPMQKNTKPSLMVDAEVDGVLRDGFPCSKALIPILNGLPCGSGL